MGLGLTGTSYSQRVSEQLNDDAQLQTLVESTSLIGRYSSCQIVLSQSPSAQSVTLGQSVSISCNAANYVDNEVNWYLQKPGQAPQLLIWWGTNRQSGIPERFSGQYSGTSFTLTISSFQAEDAGHYYCHQDYSTPFTQ
ncbi:KVD39 protein, partial [Polypterus senegalus]